MDKETLKRELKKKVDARISMALTDFLAYIDEICEAQGDPTGGVFIPKICNNCGSKDNISQCWQCNSCGKDYGNADDWEIRTDGKIQEHHPKVDK